MISVIICTYNRCSSLLQTLECLRHLDAPEQGDWELILVDNNSNDGTGATVQAFAETVCFPVRYVFERMQGLSHARNAGVAAARGEVLLFTDDDMKIDPGWLRAMERVFRLNDCAAVGGRVLPLWMCDRPAWFVTEGRFRMDDVTGTYDFGAAITQLKIAPYGNNMAIRKSMLEKYGLFRTDLGHCGQDAMVGEDTELFNRLLAADETVLYVPDATAHHRIEFHKFTMKFLDSHYFSTGRFSILEDANTNLVVKWFGVPRWIWRQVVVCAVRWMSSVKTQPRAFYRFQTFQALGSITQCLFSGKK